MPLTDLNITTEPRPVANAALKSKLIEQRDRAKARALELCDPDADVAGIDDVDAEIRSLRAEADSCQTRLDTVSLMEQPKIEGFTNVSRTSDPDLVELRSRAKQEGMIRWATEHEDREVRGAVGEYLTERYGKPRGNAGGVLIPWDWAEQTSPSEAPSYPWQRAEHETEKRADTTYSTVAGPEMGHMIYPRVLAHRGAIQALMLSPMMASYGTYSFDYLTTTATSGRVTVAATEGTRPTAPAYGITEASLAPIEIAATADITARAMNLAGPQLEQSIIADMQEDMMVYLERAAITDITGTSSITTVAAPGNANTTWAEAISTIHKIIDGIYASHPSECRFVLNPDNYRILASLYSANNRADINAFEKLHEIAAGYAVTTHMPAIASNIGNLLWRRGLHGGAFRWAVWDAAELVINHWTHGGMKHELTLRTAYAMDTEVTNRQSFVLTGIRSGA